MVVPLVAETGDGLGFATLFFARKLAETWYYQIITPCKYNSVMQQKPRIVKFKALWDNYPDEDSPCNSQFSNQCAIKVGAALAKCGVNTAAIVPRGRHCWFHDIKEGHVLAAAELAQGLNNKLIAGIQRAESLTPTNFKSRISGRTGIVYFENYWARSSDRKGIPSGDHIDLWNGSRITDWSSWIRIQMGVVIPGVWSDLEQSQKILFWRVGT